MLDAVVDGLRIILWSVAEAVLYLMDICYGIVKSIALVDFLQLPEVWNWYYFFIAFTGVLVVFRVTMIVIKFQLDEEYREKIKFSNFFGKLVMIGLTLGLLPIAIQGVAQITHAGINTIGSIVGSGTEEVPSTFILTSYLNVDNGYFSADGEWIPEGTTDYSLDDIEINAEGSDGDKYKYFNDVSDIIIIMLIGIGTALMLILNAIQIGERLFSIIIKLLVAPIPISSLIMQDDDTFTMWRKMIVADYFLNFVQTIMIIIVIILCTSSAVQALGVWVSIIMLISGFFALLKGVPELSKIIGGDTSQGSVLQQVAHLRQATAGLGRGLDKGVKSLAGAAQKIGGGLKTAGAAGMYGIGRSFGGKSMSSLTNKNTNKHFGGDNSVKESNKNTMGDNRFSQNSATADSGQKEGSSQATLDAKTQAQSKENPNMSHPKNNQSLDDANRLSRPGSIANKFSDRAESRKGLRGSSSRLVSNASAHMYKKSMRRLEGSKVVNKYNDLRSLPKRKGVES